MEESDRNEEEFDFLGVGFRFGFGERLPRWRVMAAERNAVATLGIEGRVTAAFI